MLSRAPVRILGAVGALLLLLVLAAGAAAWRLAQGPVELDALTPTIERALSDRAHGRVVRIGGVGLDWRGWRYYVALAARDVRVFKVDPSTSAEDDATPPDSALVARLPDIGITFSPLALLAGELAPSRVDLVAPRLRLVRLVDGGLSLGFDAAEGAPTGDDGSNLRDLLRPAGGDGKLARLDRMRVERADITVEDRVSGRTWRLPAVQAEAVRDATGISLSLDLAVEIGSAAMRGTARGRYAFAGNRVDGTIAWDGLRPDQVASLAPALAPLARMRLPLSGEIAFALSRPEADPAALEAVTFKLQSGGGEIVAPDSFPQPVRVTSLALAGSAQPGLTGVTLSSARIELGGPVLELKGGIAGLNDKPVLKLDGTLRSIATEDFKRLWPRDVAKGGRRWVTTNILGGQVPETAFALTVGFTGPDLAETRQVEVSGSFSYTGLVARYFQAMPPLRQVNGTATFTAPRFDFKIDSGVQGNVKLDGATIALTGLDTADKQLADIDARFSGEIADIMALLDVKPLGYAGWIGVKPEEFGGSGQARLKVKLPLIDALKVDDIDITATATLRGAAVPRLVMGRTLTDGALALDLDKTRLRVQGRARLAGIEAELDATEAFEKRAPVRRRIRAIGTVDDKQRQEFGVDTAPYAKGPIGVDLTYVETSGGIAEIAATLDLVSTALEVAPIGWGKAVGEAASGTVAVVLNRGRVEQIKRVSLEGPRLKAEGRAALGDAQRFELTRLVVGDTTDLNASITIPKQGGWTVVLRGRSLDARALLDQAQSGGAQSGGAQGDGAKGEARKPSGPTLSLDADLGQVLLDDKFRLSRMRGVLALGNGEVKRANIQARGSGGGLIAFSAQESGATRTILLTADDVGGVLKGLEVVDTVSGGSLRVEASEPLAGGALTGSIQAKEFRVVRAPAMARVLAAASLTGIRDLLAPDKGLGFTDFTASFSMRDGRISLADGRAYGSALGFTFHGLVDRRAERIDLAGTIVPAYSLNQALGSIPLIGILLTGEKGGGLFGAIYRLRGPLDEPQVSINPLSALTPGFLRNLFNLFDDGPRADPAAARDPSLAEDSKAQ